MKVKIYGERNCGTNYLEKLIENNLETEVLDFKFNKWRLFLLKNIKYDIVQDLLYRLQRKNTLGWKHGCAPLKQIESYRADSLVVVTITKNPYSFVNSLYNKPYHIKGSKPKSLSKFIKSKWITRGRDLCKKRELDSPIELWNLKNQSYIHLKRNSTKLVINLTYEELIENPEACIQRIATDGNIKFKNKHLFQNYVTSTKKSDKTYDDYKAYSVNEEWRKEFNSLDFESINTKLNLNLLELFNYQKITL